MEHGSLNLILESLGRVVEADLAVMLAAEDEQTLRVCAAAGRMATPAMRDLRIDLAQRPALAAAVRGETACLIHDAEEHDVDEPDTYADVVDMPHSHTCLAAPLRSDGQLVGVLTLDALACRAFSDAQIRAIDGFAELAARILAEEDRANRLSRELDAVVALGADLTSAGPVGASLIGQSPAWRAVLDRIRLVAGTPAGVLITGETGSGKEQVARAIHQLSVRAGGSFVAMNCSALVPELALSELFGHEKGAFTGADRRREGRFELARGGTLFLDEVADLPAKAQAQLLRVIQERTFERVGGAGQVLTADVRLVTATHKDLAAEIEAGRFREDLFYRLNTFPIRVPPLRERNGDVPVLVEHFIRAVRGELEMPRLRIAAAAVRRLAEYSWPGNVRELRNALERAAILAAGREIRLEHLDLPGGSVSVPRSTASAKPVAEQMPDGLRRLDRALAAEILSAVAESDGKISGKGGAADRLGVPATTLHSMMKRLGLKRRAV